MPFKFVAFWFLSMSIDSRHGMKRSPVSLYFLESKLANAAVVSRGAKAAGFGNRPNLQSSKRRRLSVV